MTPTLTDLLKRERTLVMGVVNATPDSFSDGGRFLDPAAAIAHGRRLADEGAAILDVGGESTAPDSPPVSAEEESRRILPIIEALAAGGAYVSADTYKAGVAREALEAGAQMVNDVTALRGDPALADVLANATCDVCIMYAKDASPRTTLSGREYDDVIDHIRAFLTERIEFARQRGIDEDRIVVDPGMGAFVSSDSAPSLELLRRISEIADLGRPVLVGASRKGFIGKVLDLSVGDRLEGSLACACVASWNGARIIRAHDVRETVRAVRMVDAIATTQGTRQSETTA